MKKILSLFLCVAILFAAIIFPESPFQKIVYAYPGDDVTMTLPDGSQYVYAEEPGYREYDETDPQAKLLFSTSRVNNWAPQDTNGDGVREYWNLSGNRCTSDSVTGGVAGSIDFKAQNNSINYGDLLYLPRYKSGDFSTNGEVATPDQELVLNKWGVTRMLGFRMVDPTPGDGNFPGVGGDSVYDYYYNIQINLNTDVDLTKYTHIYMDYWLSGHYEIRTPGLLNIAFCHSSVSKNDGLEYNINMAKLKTDGGNPRTHHTVRIDLRSWTKSYDNKVDISKINCVTFRYMTPTSNKSQYNSGSTPLIYFGKMIAYTEEDHWHPGMAWRDANGTTYTETTSTNCPDKQQATMVSLVGQNRWNTTTKLVFPMWVDYDGYRVVGLDFGDAATGNGDYRIGFLDRWPWRWGRYTVTTASDYGNVNFPAHANGGGGNYSTDIRRVYTPWLSDTTHATFTG